MALQKIRKLNANSAGITIPRDDLVLEGLVDPETGELVEEEHVELRRVEEGKWVMERVSLEASVGMSVQN